MKFNVEIFRFKSFMSYNEYYQDLVIDIDDNLMLSDLMASIANNVDDFVYDESSFAFRINDIVVFDDIKLSDISKHFGSDLIITPISIKYAINDLLIDKDAIYNKYKPILDRFDFLSEKSKEEFKKYILINLINHIDDEDYIGDGFCLYIKWMMIHYSSYAKELLELISRENGVFNSISTKYMVYPFNQNMDDDIKELQAMILNSNYKFPIKDRIIKHTESIFKSKKFIG